MWAKPYLCIMATIRFIIQSKNNPTGIFVRLKEGRTLDLKARTQFLVNPNDWSVTKGQPKNLKDAGFKRLHNDLENFKTELLNAYNKSVRTTSINSQWLKEFITPPQQPDEITTKLIEYFDFYAKHKKNEMKKASFVKLNVIKHLLERFQLATKTEYLIKDVDNNFKLKFESYCMQENYAQNTIARTIKFIKTICYHAQTNKIETSHLLQSIKTDIQKVDKIYLTIDELALIKNATLDGKEYLINARDWLIISCETGQRVSDFMRFTKEQIRYENGKPLIEFTQVKTDKIMTVPLSKMVMAILQKRGGEFPRKISDQRYNEFIKIVCKLSGITQQISGGKQNPITHKKESGIFEKWQLVTSHIGRRSFASNNYGRIPTSLLIGATGHSTEGMFLEYIGKTDTQKAIQLAEYF